MNASVRMKYMMVVVNSNLLGLPNESYTLSMYIIGSEQLMYYHRRRTSKNSKKPYYFRSQCPTCLKETLQNESNITNSDLKRLTADEDAWIDVVIKEVWAEHNFLLP